MRIGYLLILVIVLLLIFPYNHISSQSHYIDNNPYFQDNGSHSLHTNSFPTIYYLTSNISIPNGSSYSIHNTRFIVTGNYSIVDLGTLCITNSTIIGENGCNHLTVIVNGSYGYTAVIRISGSKYEIPGSIWLQNATGSFLDSELSSGYSNVSDSQKSLTFSAVYSNVFSFNSTFTGLIQTNSSLTYTAGYESFNRSIPFSSNALIPLNYRNGSGEDPLVTAITVSMQYSGDNPSGANSVVFDYFGLNYTYYFNSTGSVFTYDHACFTVPVKEPFRSSLNYSENLTAEMHIYPETGSNTTIKTLCIEYKSNDTVSYYGNNYFSYEIDHSNAIYVNSTLEFSRNNRNLCLNLQNPEHDYLDARNASLYLADSRSLSASGDCPFYLKQSSTIFCLYYVGLSFYDQGRRITNFTVSVESQSNNSTINYENSFANSAIVANNVLDGYVNNSFYETYLLSDLIASDHIVYANEYSVNLYGRNYTLSLPPYNFSSQNEIFDTYQTSLPGVAINPLTSRIIIGEENSVAFRLGDFSILPLNFSYSISFFNNTDLLSKTLNQTCYLSAGEYIQKDYDITFPNFVANRTELIITVNSSKPTIYGRNFTEIYFLEALVNASLKTSANYIWLHDDSEIALTLNISGHSGPANSLLNIEVTSYSSNATMFNRTIKVSPDNFSFTFVYNISFPSLPDNVTISATLSSHILVYVHGSIKHILPIEANSSYFAISTIVFRETGLQSGISWGIYLNDSCYTSCQATLSIQVKNGKYNFTVPGIPDFVSNISSGIIDAVFQKECINLSYSPHLYTIRIYETGLPDNYSWTVLLQSSNFTAEGNCIMIQVPNGSYILQAAAADFTSSNLSYSFVVNGHSISIRIMFNAIRSRSYFNIMEDRIAQSPITYILIIVLILLYIRVYKDSVLLCSRCLQPTGHFKRKCKCDQPGKNNKES